MIKTGDLDHKCFTLPLYHHLEDEAKTRDQHELGDYSGATTVEIVAAMYSVIQGTKH